MSIAKRIRQRVKRIFKSSSERRHELVGMPKNWKLKRDFQISFLKKNELIARMKLLDLGCGTLRGGIPIINYLESGNYTGIDIRENVIMEAKKELRRHKLEIKKPRIIHFSSFDENLFTYKFDIIFSFSVLIHLNDLVLDECIKFVSIVMDSEGVFLANVNIGDMPDGKWQGFPVVFRTLKFYSQKANKYGLKVESMGPLVNWGHNTGDYLQDQQHMLKFTKK